MRGGSGTRRIQFSSCDECRRSRVACDASAQHTAEHLPGSCTRCRNRDRPCTFKWLKEKEAKTAPNKAGDRRRKRSQPTAGSSSNLPVSNGYVTESLSEVNLLSDEHNPGPAGDRRASFLATGQNSSKSFLTLASPTGSSLASSPLSTGTLGEVEAEWLERIYQEGFEAVFGSWMGRYSCPFLFGRENSVDKYVSISNLCRHLDKWMTELASHEQGVTSQAPGAHTQEQDHKIEASLRNTIAAFSARWLPITSSDASSQEDSYAIIQTVWRCSRRDTLRIINRPSYRSMLSLFLFALTPIPAGISEDEEADGISGQACVHAALQQVQTLRAMHRNLQFSGSKVSPSIRQPTLASTPASMDTSSFIDAESIAYWAALTFDTSASLTLNCRPLLSSGLLGFESELPWRLVKTTSQVFAETSQGWRQGSAHMTDERANQIIAAAASWKLLGWKVTAIFKEALRDGHDESEVCRAFSTVLDSIKDFNAIYRGPLDECYKRIQFLGQTTKLRWFSLMLHYHLSILMLSDAIEATNRHDLLADLTDIIHDAESTVMNTLAFGLHNTMTVKRQISTNSPVDEAEYGESAFTVPIISIDPYPHHIVAGVQLVRKAIDRDFAIGNIPEETFRDLLLTLEQTLEHLPQSSKSVQAARTKFSATGNMDSL